MKGFPRSAFLAAYILSLAWYAYDAWGVYDAVRSDEAYPFFLDIGARPAAAFSIAGSVYWVTFGLDRSMTPKAVLGYVMAGAHVFVFALQVWLGPTLWAMRQLAE